jgi:F0F1-type ATP synthase membrane subunit b/b'
VTVLESSTLIVLLAFVLVGLPLAWVGGMLVQRQVSARRIGDATEHGRRIVEEAQKNAEARLKEATIEAKEVVYRARLDLERELKERQKEAQGLERRLAQRRSRPSADWTSWTAVTATIRAARTRSPTGSAASGSSRSATAR